MTIYRLRCYIFISQFAHQFVRDWLSCDCQNQATDRIMNGWVGHGYGYNWQ
jgi:hypothetical protein